MDEEYVESRLAQAKREVRDRLRPIKEFMAEVDDAGPPMDLRMRRGLSEAWLSDALAWLLDVRGSHGLGVRFAKRFLNRIGKVRSGRLADRPSPSVPYRRLKSMLRSGAAGRGTNPSRFTLGNAAVFREFSMNRRSRECPVENTLLADVVLLDLDLGDSLFVVIENKLFTPNHAGQLGNYYLLAEDKYRRASVREYVYLTVHGDEPVSHEAVVDPSSGRTDHSFHNNWVCMSWTNDILPILERYVEDSDDEYSDLTELVAFLRWLKRMTSPAATVVEAIQDLGLLTVSAVTDSLWRELSRLDEKSGSYWYTEKDKPSKLRRLYYTSLSKRPVNVRLWPPNGVALASKSGKKIRYDRLVLRLGAHPDQMFNLIEIAARDLIRQHFPDPSDHLSGGVRRSQTRNRFMEAYRPLFKFLHRYELALPVLLHRATRGLDGTMPVPAE